MSGAPEALRDLIRRATAGRAEAIEARFEIEPLRIDRVLPETEALVPVVALTGVATVELK